MTARATMTSSRPAARVNDLLKGRMVMRILSFLGCILVAGVVACGGGGDGNEPGGGDTGGGNGTGGSGGAPDGPGAGGGDEASVDECLKDASSLGTRTQALKFKGDGTTVGFVRYVDPDGFGT